MNLKNYFLKRKQLKAMQKSPMETNFYANMPYHCPKCYWSTNDLKGYITHLENHLKNNKTKKLKVIKGRVRGEGKIELS